MVNYTNRDYITSLSATDTTDGLKDGTDKIHATILRYLDLAARGNYILSYDSANFQQTAGSSRTQFGFSGNISWIRDGQLFSNSLPDRELGADPDTTHTRYDLLVINASNVSAIRQGTAGATPRGPDNLTDGDIPIALIEVVGGTGANITTRKVQLFGYNKKENQLSIGDENSGVYREVGRILPSNGDIAIVATVTNGNVDLSPNGTGDVQLGTLVIDGDQTVGSGQDGYVLTYTHSNTKAALAALPATYSDSDAVSAIETEAGLNFSTSSSDAIIANTTQDKDIIFQVNDGGGGGASTEVMRIDGDVSRVGIGTATPVSKLEVKGDTAISRSVDSGQTRTLIIEGARNAVGTDYARIDLKNYDSNGPTSYVGARISAVNEADGVNDGTLTFSTNNANAGITEAMRITDDRKVCIGTTTPGDGILTINGAINTKGRIQQVVHKTGDNGLSGGPPLPSYDILKTDDLIIANAPAAGGGLPPNDLVLNLPDAESVDIGRTYRIVAQTVSSTLQINRTGSDDSITDTTGAVLSLPYSLAGGKIYDIICVDADMWMLMQLN